MLGKRQYCQTGAVVPDSSNGDIRLMFVKNKGLRLFVPSVNSEMFVSTVALKTVSTLAYGLDRALATETLWDMLE